MYNIIITKLNNRRRMNKKSTMFLYNRFEKISMEIWYLKSLAKILEEVLLNNNKNLNSSDICTLSEILKRTIFALSNQAEKFEKELGCRLL